MLLVRSFFYLGVSFSSTPKPTQEKVGLYITIFFSGGDKVAARKKGFPFLSLTQKIRHKITIFANIKHPTSNIQLIMKVIQIKAKDFFEFIKLKDTSMWEIFSQMIDGEEKEIIFLDEEEKILFNYILPQNLEKLEEDRKTFAKEYADKISNLN